MAWLSDASRAGWQRLRGERIVIAASGESTGVDGILTVVERDGLFGDWMRQNAVAAVIVRPDRYVFAATDSADQLNMLVQQLLQNLSAGREAFQDAALSVPPE
jgi:3-(3-hydroxy-phenyl)propionate hydroxylase